MQSKEGLPPSPTRPRTHVAGEPARALAPVALPSAVVALGQEEKSAGPPALTAGPTASTLLQALRRRWLTATLTAVVGSAAVAALAFLAVPGRYNAVALVKVSPRNLTQAVLGDNDQNPDPAAFKSNQEAIIKGPVLEEVRKNPEFLALPLAREQASPAEWLAKALKVEFKGVEVAQISLSGDDPQALAAVVNCVAQAYRAFMAGQEKKSRDALLAELKASGEKARTSLLEKQTHLRNLLELRKLDDPDTAKAKYDSVLRQLDEVRKELRQLEQTEIDAVQQQKTEREWAESASPQQLPEVLVFKYLKDDPVYRQLRTNIAQKDDAIQNAQTNLTGAAAAPIVARLEQEKAALLRALESYHKAQLPAIAREIQAEARIAVAKLDSHLSGIRQKQKARNGELKRLQEDARQLAPGAQRTAAVETLHQEILAKKEVLERLDSKIAHLDMLPALGGPVTILQPAEPPQTLDRSKQIKVAGGAGLGTFLLLLFGVAFLEFRSRRINTASEVTEGLGLSLIGTLPALPERARRVLPGPAGKRDTEWQNRLTESVDAIRTLLLHAARTEDLQVVMVTSANSGEGKTSLAGHLAASLARAWRKTLLIDGDLRNPAIHQLLDQPLEPGFSEVLRSEVGVHDAVRPTAVSRLWMMPAGHWDSHAVQALAQESVRSLFEQLKEQYDFIVVDSCPVLPVADSLLLGQHVDAVLLSVLRDVSRAPAIHAAQKRLEGLGIRTLGAVVIGADAEHDNASYLYQTKAGS